MKYWTQLNKGYNVSRIFGKHVHFANDPAADPDNSGDEGGAGGGSGSGDDDSAESLAKAQAERDAEIARNDKLKKSLDKTMKELADLKKKQRDQLSSDQQAQLAREEHEQELAELKAKLRAKEYVERLMEIGMAKNEASALSEIIPEFKDDDASDTFFSQIGKFIESAKKTAGEEALQKFIRDNHVDIAGGTGSNPVNVAVERAKALREGRSAGANKDILGKYAR